MMSTATPTSTPIAAHTPAPPPALSIDPVATAPMLRVGSWSPDGGWLTYWTFTEEEAATSHLYPPGTLHFLNARADRTCVYEGEAPHGLGGESVVWLADDRLAVVNAGEVRVGAPCGPFVAADDVPIPESDDPSAARSPGGTYLARSEIEPNADSTLSVTTTISAVATGRTTEVISWAHRGGLGGLGLGGQWLSDDEFLIYETLDRGPLLVSVGKRISEVARDLFGVPSVPVPIPVEGETEWYAWRAAAAVRGTELYHLALTATGFEAHFPSVRLYHPETGVVEELPFKYLWGSGFSPDGRYLTLDSRPIVDNHEVYALWFRAVDPAGSEPQLLAADLNYSAVWSPDLARIGVGTDDRVLVYTFPETTVLQAWDTGMYTGIPIAWSPDGSRLMVYGYATGQLREALFVIDLP
jgi:hypothetical protein